MQQNLLERFLDGSLMPHGYCLLWRGDLLFLHLGGDILTALAYFTIPAALVYLVRKRGDLAFDWVFMLFAMFIFLCGLTHALAVLNIWQGYYFIEGVAKLATGIVSAYTALTAWRLMPRALAIPSRSQLQEKIEALEAAEGELARANAMLETNVRERTAQLEQLARTDELTQLWNRREILERIHDELRRSQRSGSPPSLLLIDLDNFKFFNDRFGHSAGDAVLRAFADTARECVRFNDSLGRLGGEEFVGLLPDTDALEATQLAERLRKALTERKVIHEGEELTVTCSIGIAEGRADEAVDAFVNRADRAMYTAKAAGRDRVVVDRGAPSGD